MEVPDDAASLQRGGPIHVDIALLLRAIHDQRAGADRRVSRVSVVARERPRTGAQFEETACADDDAGEGGRITVCTLPEYAAAQINEATTIDGPGCLVVVVQVETSAEIDVHFSGIEDLVVARQPKNIRSQPVADGDVRRARRVGGGLIQQQGADVDKQVVKTVRCSAAEDKRACACLGKIETAANTSTQIQKVSRINRDGGVGG